MKLNKIKGKIIFAVCSLACVGVLHAGALKNTGLTQYDGGGITDGYPNTQNGKDKILSSRNPLESNEDVTNEISIGTNSLDVEEFKRKGNGICCSEPNQGTVTKGVYQPKVDSPSEIIRDLKFSGGEGTIASDNSEGFNVSSFFYGDETIALRVRKSGQHDFSRPTISASVVGDKVIMSGGSGAYNRYGFNFSTQLIGGISYMCMGHKRAGVLAIPENGHNTWTEGVSPKSVYGCFGVTLFDDNKKARGHRRNGGIKWSIKGKRDICVTMGSLDDQPNMTHWWVNTKYYPPQTTYTPYVYVPSSNVYGSYIDFFTGKTVTYLIQAKGSISTTGHDVIKYKGQDKIVWAHWEQGYRHTNDDHGLNGFGGMNAGTYCFKYLLERGNNLLNYEQGDRFDNDFAF